MRLYAHLQATDPERFVVAVRPDRDAPGGERIVAFAAAVLRERLWFLSMLLRPARGAGERRRAGRSWTRVGPPAAASTSSGRPRPTAPSRSPTRCTPRSGSCPAIPLLNLIGHADRAATRSARCRAGVTPVPFDELVAGEPGGDGHARLARRGRRARSRAARRRPPVDHRFLRQEGRRGWLYLGPDGAPVGYGYAGEAGRVGPVAVRDEALLAPVLGHLTQAVVPRGAFALWLPGSADRAVVTAALQAGFRLEPFPLLLCWDRPFADLDALPADLARDCSRPAPDRTIVRVPLARRHVCRAPGPDGSLGPTWLPLPCPRTESRRS